MYDRETIVAVLAASEPDPRLREVAQQLYAQWRPLSLGAYPSLAPGPRDTAFGVIFRQLAREAKQHPLQPADLDRRATALLAEPLCRQHRRGQRNGQIAERCLKWFPANQNGLSLTPDDVPDALWRASMGDTDDRVTAILSAIRTAWMRRRVFLQLTNEEREDAIQEALLRSILPVEAASITPASAPYRLRGIALRALSDAARRQRRDHPAGNPPDATRSDNSSREDEAPFRRFVARLVAEMTRAARATNGDRPRKYSRSKNAEHQQASRERKFLERAAEEVHARDYPRTEEARRGLYDAIRAAGRVAGVSQRFAARVALAIDWVLASDIARLFMPVALVGLMARVATALKRMLGASDDDSGDDRLAQG